MKIFLLAILLAAAGPLPAEDSPPQRPVFKYDFALNANGYDLKINFTLSEDVSLQQVVSNLTSPVLLHELGSQVVSLEQRNPLIDGQEKTYHSLMRIRTYGYPSKFLSTCHEKWAEDSWERSCQLETSILDGGKYLESKADLVVCEKKEGLVSCRIQVAGKMQDLEILGFQVMEGKFFAARTRYHSLQNYAKVWYYTALASVSEKFALRGFSTSALAVDIDNCLEQALEELGKGPVFRRVSPEIHLGKRGI